MSLLRPGVVKQLTHSLTHSLTGVKISSIINATVNAHPPKMSLIRLGDLKQQQVGFTHYKLQGNTPNVHAKEYLHFFKHFTQQV